MMNTKKQQLTVSLKTGTMFVTADVADTIMHNPGTGCSLEVCWWPGNARLQISGHATALASLDLNPALYESSAFMEQGTMHGGREGVTEGINTQHRAQAAIEDLCQGYVSLWVDSSVMNRLELNDLLVGLGWHLAGTSSNDKTTNMFWTRGATGFKKRSKHH